MKDLLCVNNSRLCVLKLSFFRFCLFVAVAFRDFVSMLPDKEQGWTLGDALAWQQYFQLPQNMFNC